MACEYCNVKIPGKNAAIRCGNYPIGKPFFTNKDEYGIYVYAVISHKNGCLAIPDEDEWRLNYTSGGAGHYIPINYCPICGRDLRGDNND